MVVDSSAILAVVLAESDAILFRDILESTELLRISSATLVELRIVAIGKKQVAVVSGIDRLLTIANVQVEAFTPQMAAVAIQAFQKFGKGRHPAALNFGDCMAYATARVLSAPLLCKGRGFAQTDLLTLTPPA